MEGWAKVALTGLGEPVGTGTWFGCLEQCQAKQDSCKQNQLESWIKAPFAFSGHGRRLQGCSACALDVVDGRDRQTRLLSRPSSGNGYLLLTNLESPRLAGNPLLSNFDLLSELFLIFRPFSNSRGNGSLVFALFRYREKTAPLFFPFFDPAEKRLLYFFPFLTQPKNG